MLEGRLLLILSHADLSFGPQYYQRLLDTICCHLVAGRVRDQEVGLSGKQSATTALHDTDTARRFPAGERPSALRSASPSCHSTRSEEHTSELQSLTNLVC